jgi:hypothetical protein
MKQIYGENTGSRIHQLEQIKRKTKEFETRSRS